jgi:hypothetical protein
VNGLLKLLDLTKRWDMDDLDNLETEPSVAKPAPASAAFSGVRYSVELG